MFKGFYYVLELIMLMFILLNYTYSQGYFF
jgi:hypothetical protein